MHDAVKLIPISQIYLLSRTEEIFKLANVVRQKNPIKPKLKTWESADKFLGHNIQLTVWPAVFALE